MSKLQKRKAKDPLYKSAKVSAALREMSRVLTYVVEAQSY